MINVLSPKKIINVYRNFNKQKKMQKAPLSTFKTDTILEKVLEKLNEKIPKDPRDPKIRVKYFQKIYILLTYK